MPRRNKNRYQQAERSSRRAERLTRLLFNLAGYSCIASRYKTPFGELDLVMKRGRSVVILEVKYRASIKDFDAALISPRQCRRIYHAGNWLQGHMPELSNCNFSVKLVQWIGWFFVKHTELYFDLS